MSDRQDGNGYASPKPQKDLVFRLETGKRGRRVGKKPHDRENPLRSATQYHRGMSDTTAVTIHTIVGSTRPNRIPSQPPGQRNRFAVHLPPEVYRAVMNEQVPVDPVLFQPSQMAADRMFEQLLWWARALKNARAAARR